MSIDLGTITLRIRKVDFSNDAGIYNRDSHPEGDHLFWDVGTNCLYVTAGQGVFLVAGLTIPAELEALFEDSPLYVAGLEDFEEEKQPGEEPNEDPKAEGYDTFEPTASPRSVVLSESTFLRMAALIKGDVSTIDIGDL